MNIKQVLFSLILTAGFTASLYAFNWPLSEPVVTSTFGSEKNGGFGNGIEIYGSETAVHPSESGELIFYRGKNSSSRLPSSLGGFAVIEHERKLRTLYSNLMLSENIDEMTAVETFDIIGEAELFGTTVEPYIYFSVIDSEFEQYVNPMLLLNSIVDNLAPVISEVGIRGDEGYTPLADKTVIKSGKSELLAEIFDPCMSDPNVCRMAPFKIHLFLNGEEIFHLTFESISSNDDLPYIQAEQKLKYNEYYRDNNLISLGEINLVPGDSRFEILVRDYAGNETGIKFQLTVIE